MFQKITLLVLILLLVSNIAVSKNIVCCKQVHYKPLDITNQVVYFEDVEGFKNIADIKKIEQSQFKNLSNYNVEVPTSAIWIRFEICNFSLSNRFVLNLAEWRFADSIDIYSFKENKLLTIKKSGYFRKASELDYSFSNKTSKTGLVISYGDTLTVYARYRTFSGFGSNPELTIEHEQIVLKNNRREGVVQGLFQGMVWLIAIFSLLFFIFLRERLYLYYSIYIMLFSIYILGQDGFLFELIVSNHPTLSNIIYAGASAFSPAFFLLFTREIIIRKKELDFWLKGHLVFTYIYLLSAVAVVISLILNNIKLAFILVNFSILTSFFYLAPFIIRLSRLKDLESRYVFLGTTIILLSTVFGVLSLQFNIQLGKLSSYDFIKIGVIVELLFFSAAIAYRLYANEVDKKHTREKLIEQLKINHSIKDKMNEELEELVKLRTAELENQNSEIMAQRDDIYDKSQILIEKSEKILTQKEIIEHTHKQLTDSVNYARIIQNAIIPPAELIGLTFDDSFLLNKPKDVVSGDFYWINQNEGKPMIAVADCTGHGVPGAMLSVLGISTLDKISTNSNKYTPGKILDVLRKEIKISLRQDNEKIAKEGMDISLCLFDNENNKLLFSGAQQPGLIVRTSEIIQMVPTKQPIGKYIKESPFEDKIYDLRDGDMIYLFSDGYYDQMGGEFRKKLMTKKFKQLLQDIHNLDCSQQKNILGIKHDDWKGYNDQTDDIIILGIRYRN